MYSRPNLTGSPSQRIAAAAPLALFLVMLGVFSWAGRDQLKAAIEASGAFVAAQFGQSKVQQNSHTDAKGSSDAVVSPTALVLKQAGEQKPAVAAATEDSAPKAVTNVDTPGHKVIVEVDDKGRKLQILEAPIPPDCYPRQHADFAGDAVVWGLGHKKASAAECCAACKEHQLKHATDRPCNIWVWCGDPSGVCWTMDIHNHTTGDCWLKHQATWDNNPDLTKSNLMINHQGKFTTEFRVEHKTAPEYVPWVAGVVPVRQQRLQRRLHGVQN